MIAVTGIGTISAMGIGKDAMLDSLRNCRAGTGLCDDPALGPYILGRVRDFKAKDFIPAMKARRLSRFTQLALCSAIEAVDDSGLDIKILDPFRTAVIFGTALASTGSTDSFYQGLLENGPQDTNPIVFPETVPNAAASQIAIHFGITGPNTTFSQNEISAELALDYAMDLLLSGRVDTALVGSAEELNGIALKAFSSLRLISSNGAPPFDRGSNGMVPAEGGAVLVLERAADAIKRSAPIHAIIPGRAALVSAPVSGLHYDTSGESMSVAMHLALGGIRPEEVGLVSAAASGIRELDRSEAGAVGEVFGNKVPLTAFRAYAGTATADGALRMAAAMLCMKDGIVPGMPGLEAPLSDKIALRSDSISGDIRYALVNSFSFGGGAASVLFQRPENNM